MIGREDFTTPEWRDLQTAIMGTVKYMTMVSPHIYGDIKDQLVAKQAIKDYIEDTESGFIKELADFDDYKSPFPDRADDTAEGIESDLLRAITNSVAAVQKRDPDTVTIFKNLILKVAYNTATARIQISPEENAAFQKIALALESQPEPEVKEWDPANPLAKP
jgi:hypothetical protein